MKLSMISAMAHGRVIGTGHGGIPWHLPRDVKHFREYTQGKHLLLGRRTFEEMLGWFTDHPPIVLTHNTNYDPEVGSVAQTSTRPGSFNRSSRACRLRGIRTLPYCPALCRRTDPDTSRSFGRRNRPLPRLWKRYHLGSRLRKNFSCRRSQLLCDALPSPATTSPGRCPNGDQGLIAVLSQRNPDTNQSLRL